MNISIVFIHNKQLDEYINIYAFLIKILLFLRNTKYSLLENTFFKIIFQGKTLETLKIFFFLGKYLLYVIMTKYVIKLYVIMSKQPSLYSI